MKRGETHALMGPNGSGKSTLANVLMGNDTYEVTEGQIIFNGEDITEESPEARSQAGRRSASLKSWNAPTRNTSG